METIIKKSGKGQLPGHLTVLLTILICSALTACSSDENDSSTLLVHIEGWSMSKLAFVIAADQGFYEKHGLDVKLTMSPPEFEGARIPKAPILTRVMRNLGMQEYPQPEILVTGHTPIIYDQVMYANTPKRVALASTDCSVRYYVVARDGIERVEDIHGKRIGVNAVRTTSGFAALRLIERMNWDRRYDVAIMERGRNVEFLKSGRVDVVVGGDETFEAAQREGLNVLQDTRSWNENLAGNSASVETGWLDDSGNRNKAQRFLMAALEGLALFHQDPELAIDIAMRWYGFPTLEMAQGRYARADYVPLKPYPCYQGIENTMRIHDSHEMRQYKPEDFYDDSLLKELDQSGFIDALYSQ